MSFYSLIDQARMTSPDRFLRTDTLGMGMPTFAGGGQGPMMAPQAAVPVATDGRPGMQMPLSALYPPANVPVPATMSELVGSGGTDPYNFANNPAMRPRVPQDNLLADPPAMTAGMQPAPVSYGLLDGPVSGGPGLRMGGGEGLKMGGGEGLNVGQTGEMPAAAKASPFTDGMRRLGSAAKAGGERSNVPEPPRITVQAPQAGVGGRPVDVSAYLRMPINKRRAKA